jgi:hypothetical protein
MKWLLLSVVMLLSAPALATSAWAQSVPQPAPATGAVGPATPLTPSPDDRAKQWLNLVDDQNYNDAYKQMSAAAQQKTALGPWAGKVGQERAPLGAMASRSLKTVNLTKMLPGMRDGQSATVQFDSSFAHKASAVETVVLTSEKGAWSVTSYAID